MSIRKCVYRCCALGVIMAFTSTHVMAQTFLPRPSAPPTQESNRSESSGVLQLAAAIGIVKPKTESPSSSEEVKDAPSETVTAEPSGQQSSPSKETAATTEMSTEASGMGVSKLAIGAGIGLAALLAAVAGSGGGGGNSTPPTHSASP